MPEITQVAFIMFIYCKALHIVFVVSWFSGMFYLCRLLVYLRESNDKPQTERDILVPQLLLMTKRLLYFISIPAMFLTLSSGSLLLLSYDTLPVWLYLKLGLVILLLTYQYSLYHIFQQFQKRASIRYSSSQLRLWNEIPTVLLVLIVMLAVVKTTQGAIFGFVGVLAFLCIVFLVIRIYKIL